MGPIVKFVSRINGSFSKKYGSICFRKKDQTKGEGGGPRPRGVWQRPDFLRFFTGPPPLLRALVANYWNNLLPHQSQHQRVIKIINTKRRCLDTNMWRSTKSQRKVWCISGGETNIFGTPRIYSSPVTGLCSRPTTSTPLDSCTIIFVQQLITTAHTAKILPIFSHLSKLNQACFKR